MKLITGMSMSESGEYIISGTSMAINNKKLKNRGFSVYSILDKFTGIVR